MGANWRGIDRAQETSELNDLRPTCLASPTFRIYVRILLRLEGWLRPVRLRELNLLFFVWVNSLLERPRRAARA